MTTSSTTAPILNSAPDGTLKPVNNSTLAKLLSPPGWALLNELPAYDEAESLRLGEVMRKRGVDPELAAAVLTQSRLRKKAEAKFGELAAGMLFTPAGLEQATRLPVAAVHAQRFRAAGSRHIADLTCGIGADSLAFGALGVEVLALDIDEATAALATVNLRAFPNVTVAHGDCLTHEFPASVDALWADPARRTGTQRVFNPQDFTPPLTDILALRARIPALGVKIAPGIPHEDLPTDAETQWISVDGAVVEAGLWFGPLRHEKREADASPITRSALLLSSAGPKTLITDADPTHREQVPAGPLETWVHEPDGAVIRAGLIGAIAADIGGHLLDESIAYVTTDLDASHPATTRYRVRDAFPFNLKKLRSYLRERGVGQITIKKRGTAITPEELRGKLALKGSGVATIILTRIAGVHSVIVVDSPDL